MRREARDLWCEALGAVPVLHLAGWPGLSPGCPLAARAHEQGGAAGRALCCCCRSGSCRVTAARPGCARLWWGAELCVFITQAVRQPGHRREEGRKKHLGGFFSLCFSWLLDYFGSYGVVYQDSLVVIMPILNNLLFTLYCWPGNVNAVAAFVSHHFYTWSDLMFLSVIVFALWDKLPCVKMIPLKLLYTKARKFINWCQCVPPSFLHWM